MKAGKAVLSAGVCALVLALSPVLAFAATPNDPLYSQQWALSGSAPSINAPQAWCSSLGNVLVADTNSGIGMAGVAPAARALIVKVLKNDASGTASGSATDVAAGIDYASSYPGVRVINLSIGSDTPGLVLNLLGGQNPILPAIDRAIQRGVMVSAAAGNTPGATSDYAGQEGEARGVGPLNKAGTITSYSTAANIYPPAG